MRTAVTPLGLRIRTSPVTTTLPTRMAPALNDHPVVAEILTSRASSISKNAAEEAIVIVAHGPTKDAENQMWLKDMKLYCRTSQVVGNVRLGRLHDAA